MEVENGMMAHLTEARVFLEDEDAKTHYYAPVFAKAPTDLYLLFLMQSHFISPYNTLFFLI